MNDIKIKFVTIPKDYLPEYIVPQNDIWNGANNIYQVKDFTVKVPGRKKLSATVTGYKIFSGNHEILSGDFITSYIIDDNTEVSVSGVSFPYNKNLESEKLCEIIREVIINLDRLKKMI